MPLPISPEITAAIKAHAIEVYPNESCGFITAEGYVPVENIAEDPQNHFKLAPTAFLTYQNAIAFVHSHPVADCFLAGRYQPGFYPFCPSADDMRSQIATGMNFGIVVTDGNDCHEPFYWGDFILDDPLYGQNFRHGVDDCYSIIRKWYWQERNIKLADIPRSDGWWLRDDDLYMRSFPSVGFVQIGTLDEPQIGDLGLVQLGNSSVKSINHGFLYLGDGTICHHLPGRLSSRDAVGGRRKEQKLWIRYVGRDHPVQPSPMVF